MIVRPRHALPRRVAGIASLVAALSTPAAAHVVVTKDGKTYEGKVTADDASHVVIETTFDGTKDLARADVAKVDLTTPPLREQLAFRVESAKDDPKALADAAEWAKRSKFTKEVDEIWRRVVAVDPQNARARKALGHVRVGGTWMTPEEKSAAERAAEEAAMRAKGLVPHEGRWVTPEEKQALEKGLVRDGDEWVTEDEFRRRRGETLVDGKWVRAGEAETKARAAALSKVVGVALEALWSPNVDLVHELPADAAKGVLDAAEKAAVGFRRLVRPGPDDKLSGFRVPVYCFHKSPAYARFAQVFEEENVKKPWGQGPGWAAAAARQPGFWTIQPVASGHYLHPNTPKRLESGVAHNVALVLLGSWRLKSLESPWLQEGLAYHVELEAIGRSETFSVGRGGGAAGGDPAAVGWTDSAKWKDALRGAVLKEQDAPMPRLAGFRPDDFAYVDLVKAWSVVDWLVKVDADKFRSFLAGAKVRDKPEEDAMKEAYGFDWRGLESRWRRYAENGFTTP